jgi:RNA methyltransferase, TrmH family
MIISAQNAKVKLVRSLAGRAKERREAGAFVAEGVRLVEEARLSGWPIRFVLHTDEISGRGTELIAKLQEARVEVDQVDRGLMQSLSDTETSQGILAVLEDHELPIVDPLDFVLVLDAIRDPGNLGTLLRSAAASGVQAILLSSDTVDAFSPKVVRAGMGSHFRLPIRSMNWDQLRDRTRGLKIYLADMEGAACWKVDFRSPMALIVGGEASGGSQAARNIAQGLVSIPMLGQTESLNAAVAGSVLMFEVLRQRSNI